MGDEGEHGLVELIKEGRDLLRETEAENERLRAAIIAEVAEIRGSHYPDADAYGRMCRICGASDGGWPCVARMAADDLEAALSGRTEAPDA